MCRNCILFVKKLFIKNKKKHLTRIHLDTILDTSRTTYFDSLIGKRKVNRANLRMS
jgi:hypothetical protein